jgi:hypothetical protein
MGIIFSLSNYRFDLLRYALEIWVGHKVSFINPTDSFRTEQNRIFIGLKSRYKGLLPKQHIKYKTK